MKTKHVRHAIETTIALSAVSQTRINNAHSLIHSALKELNTAQEEQKRLEKQLAEAKQLLIEIEQENGTS